MSICPEDCHWRSSLRYAHEPKSRVFVIIYFRRMLPIFAVAQTSYPERRDELGIEAFYDHLR